VSCDVGLLSPTDRALLSRYPSEMKKSACRRACGRLLNSGAGLSLDVRTVEAQLPPSSAHAGAARRAVMDLAEAWLEEGGETDGVILTTDAGSQVAPNWIAENLAAFRMARGGPRTNRS
jgi:hypothetical protein